MDLVRLETTTGSVTGEREREREREHKNDHGTYKNWFDQFWVDQ